MVDLNRQNNITSHFERMYQTGTTPWRDHPSEPALSHFLKFLKEKSPSAKLLDIGCGDGWISIKAAQISFEVWGIDGSETAIAQAKEAALRQDVENKVHFQVGNALNLPYKADFFDAAIDRGLFHHILPTNRSAYMENILKVLKNRSFIYLSVFSLKNPEGIGQRFTKKTIEDLFNHHFSIIFFDQDPYPTSAPAHLLHFVLKRSK